jgi:hypothetical protein
LRFRRPVPTIARMRLCFALSVVLTLTAAVSCDEQPSSGPVAADPATPAASAPPANAPRPAAPDPEYTLAVSDSEADPKTYKVTWSAKVNTGGWKMTTEQVLVEESMRKVTARVYVILEEPGPDEMVTQAQETLIGTHDAGATKVDAAELSVKRTRRAGQPAFLPMYVVVKRAG